MNFPEDTNKSTEYAALKSYLSDDKSLDDAIKDYTSNSSSNSPEEKLFHSWDATMLLASQTSDSSPCQAKLVDFLTALHKHDAPVGKIDGKETSWSELPLYGRRVREHWHYDEEKAQNDKEISEHWANVNAFGARVTASATSFDGSDPLDFSIYAIWALRAALEDKDEVPAATVRTASMWILYAGHVLRRLSKEQRAFEDETAKAGDKYPNKEWKGFSMDRWRSWENRFANISEVDPHDEIKDLAKQARRKMQDLAA